MGTSSSYNGPVSPSWKHAKNQARSFARNGGRDSAEALVRSYVQANGGARVAASAAVAGRKVAERVVAFLSEVQRAGLGDALQDAGLDHLIGQAPASVLCGLLDYLTGPGSLLEEAAAKTALEELFEERFEDTESWSTLEQALTEAQIGEVLEDYLCRYIFVRITNDLGSRLENASALPEHLAERYTQLLECIRALVRLDTRGVDLLQIDWTGSSGQQRIQGWLEESYRFLGGGE